MRVPCIVRWPNRIAPGVSSTLSCSLDFYATLAHLAGADATIGKPNDSIDVTGFLLSPDHAESPRDTFFYYNRKDLEAVRHGDWKLRVRCGEAPALFNLAEDIGEEVNRYTEEPALVMRLYEKMAHCRAALGDAAADVSGSEVRHIGRVANPKKLTAYDENHPYIIAAYDKADCG